MATRGSFGRDPSDMFNYLDIIRIDPFTIKILSFHSNKHSFVIQLQQQFLKNICNY